MIRSLAFQPAGRLMAAVDDNGIVRLWDLDKRQEVRSFASSGSQVAFSPDGALLATGGESLLGQGVAVRLWDAATGRELRPLEGHHDAVRTLAFAPDGKNLACGGWVSSTKNITQREGRILLYDTATWQPRVLPNVADLNDISFVTFSPDSRRLAAIDFFGKIRVWDLPTGKVLKNIDNAMGSYGIASLAFVGADRLAYLQHDPVVAAKMLQPAQARLTIIDLEKGDKLEVPTQGNPVSVAFVRARGELAVGTRAGTIQFIALANLKIR